MFPNCLSKDNTVYIWYFCILSVINIEILINIFHFIWTLFANGGRFIFSVVNVYLLPEFTNRFIFDIADLGETNDILLILIPLKGNEWVDSSSCFTKSFFKKSAADFLKIANVM